MRVIGLTARCQQFASQQPASQPCQHLQHLQHLLPPASQPATPAFAAFAAFAEELRSACCHHTAGRQQPRGVLAGTFD